MRFAGISLLKRCPAVVFLMKYPKTLLAFSLFCLTWLALIFICSVLCVKNAQINPLFHSTSPVTDISNGSVDIFHAILQKSSLQFVMFYTHWCAQSRKLVYEFHRASRKYEGQVSFIAINCWAGSCKQNYHFHSYPQLFFHHTFYIPIEYKGRHKTSHIIRFINKAIYPFTYISNKDILQKFIKQGKPTLLAFFNGTNYQDDKYKMFFGTAFHSINKATSLQFGVITCFQVAALVNLNQFGQVVLVNAFELPQAYPTWLNFSHVSMFQWAEQHKVEYVKELDPDFTDSKEFGAMMIENGASLILFVCKNDKDSNKALLGLYHQVALDYHNCSCEKTQSENVTDDLPVTRATREDAHAGACDVRVENAHVTSCQSLPLSHDMRNVCDVCRECYETCSCAVDSSPLRISLSTLGNLTRLHNGCSSLRKNYQGCHVLSVCCFQGAIPRFREMLLAGGFAADSGATGDGRLRELTDNLVNEDIVDSRNDPGILKRIMGNLMTMFSSEVAGDGGKPPDGFPGGGGENTSSRDASRHAPVYYEYGTCERRGKVRVFAGADCYSNITVNFYSMDSRKYWSYALALGVRHDLPVQLALVLVDVKNEAQYVLPEDTELTNTSLVDFVMNFTRGNLTRRLRSAPVPVQPCLNDGCMVEVVSLTFTQLVLDTHKDVFLMYYSTWCGFCRSVKPICLALADHYKHSTHIRIARINADVNDLPWEYTVDSYPTFVFFPAKRKDLSVAFPDDEDRTLENFIRFVEKHKRLARVSSTWHEKVAWLDHVYLRRLGQEKEALRRQNDVLRWRLRRELERRRESEIRRLVAERQFVELLDEAKDDERALFDMKAELRKLTLENAHLFEEVSEAKKQLIANEIDLETSKNTVVELQADNRELERIVHVLESENVELSNNEL